MPDNARPVKLIVDYLVEGQSKVFNVPIMLWGVIIIAHLIEMYHIYFSLHIKSIPYMVQSWIFWLLAPPIIYPSLEKFFKKDAKGNYIYEKTVFEFLDNIYVDKIKWVYNSEKSNILVLIMTIVAWIVWMLGIYIIYGDLELHMLFLTGTYMIVWLFVFSALHYIFSINWELFRRLKEENIDKIKISSYLLDILFSDEPIHEFLKFKSQLESLFSPLVSVNLRASLVVILSAIAYSVFYRVFGEIPKQELYSVLYAISLIMIGALLSLIIFMYLTIKLSINLKEIMLVEIKEVKYQISKMNDERYNLLSLSINEIEDIAKNIRLILVPSKDILDIVGAILAILLFLLGMYS